MFYILIHDTSLEFNDKLLQGVFPLVILACINDLSDNYLSRNKKKNEIEKTEKGKEKKKDLKSTMVCLDSHSGPKGLSETPWSLEFKKLCFLHDGFVSDQIFGIKLLEYYCCLVLYV